MGLDLEIKRTAAEDVQEMLDQTVFGSEGGMRYRHTAVRARISEFLNPYFINLRKGDRLLGTITLDKRTFETGFTGMDFYYIRYFSFLDKLRTKKFKNTGRKKSSPIKKAIDEIFEHRKMEESSEEAIYFAYMEAENQRSNRITSELGFQPFRKFSTTIFSRFFPSTSEAVSPVKEVEERESVRRALTDFYRDHDLFNTDQLFRTGDYFVLKEDGKPVCGVQARPIHWEIMEMPGWSGKLIYHFVPYIPLLSRVFNPANYQFLALEYAFHKENRGHRLQELFEHILHVYKINSAIIWADSESELYTTLRGKNRLGIMNKMQRDVPAHIIARYAGPDPRKLHDFGKRPAYISAFDLT